MMIWRQNRECEWNVCWGENLARGRGKESCVTVVLQILVYTVTCVFYCLVWFGLGFMIAGWLIWLFCVISWIYGTAYWLKMFWFLWNKKVTETLLLTSLELRKALSSCVLCFTVRKLLSFTRGGCPLADQLSLPTEVHSWLILLLRGCMHLKWYLGMTDTLSKCVVPHWDCGIAK